MPTTFYEQEEATVTVPLHFQRSEAVNEIVSQRPSFLVRWGLTLFLFILLGLVAITWFISYPDIVPAKAKLTSLNAPKAIITKTAGQLISLRLKEGELVEQGAIIGSMESIGSEAEIVALNEDLNSMAALLQNGGYNHLQTFTHKQYSQLGELQGAYQTFAQALLTYCNYIPGGFMPQKKALLQNDKRRLQALKMHLKTQQQLSEKDLALQQKTFDANDYLLQEKIISPLEYRKEQSSLLGKEQALPQNNIGLIGNESQQADKQKEILELDNTMQQQRLLFTEALHTLQAALADWKSKYLLIAPLSGRVAFATFLQVAQQLPASQTICYINPANSSYYAEIYIPQANFGKVVAGQKVLLKFAAYPDAEYGSLEGRLEAISHMATDSGYLAKVAIPANLITNYGKSIQFHDGLTASAEIITKDMRLLERFYYNISKEMRKE